MIAMRTIALALLLAGCTTTTNVTVIVQSDGGAHDAAPDAPVAVWLDGGVADPYSDDAGDTATADVVTTVADASDGSTCIGAPANIVDTNESADCRARTDRACPACAPVAYECVGGKVPSVIVGEDAGIALSESDGDASWTCTTLATCVLADSWIVVCRAYGGTAMAWACPAGAKVQAGCELQRGTLPGEGAIYCCP